MPGYNLCRSDHSSNTKRGRTCHCYKNCVPLKIADIQYLQECINFKKKISEKIYNFVALYHSSSHSQDEFERFPKIFSKSSDPSVILTPSQIFGIKMIKQFMKVPKLMA